MKRVVSLSMGRGVASFCQANYSTESQSLKTEFELFFFIQLTSLWLGVAAVVHWSFPRQTAGLDYHLIHSLSSEDGELLNK